MSLVRECFTNKTNTNNTHKEKMAYHGPRYGMSAEVAAKHAAKYDVAMENALRFFSFLFFSFLSFLSSFSFFLLFIFLSSFLTLFFFLKRTWMEAAVGRAIGEDFHEGLKDGIFLCE